MSVPWKVSSQLDDSTGMRLKQLCEDRGMTTSEAVRTLIESALNDEMADIMDRWFPKRSDVSWTPLGQLVHQENRYGCMIPIMTDHPTRGWTAWLHQRAGASRKPNPVMIDALESWGVRVAVVTFSSDKKPIHVNIQGRRFRNVAAVIRKYSRPK